MDNIKKPVFLYSPELEKYSYPPESLFNTHRAGKTRDLLMSLDLLGGGCGAESSPVPATSVDLERFHTAKYLDTLRQAADGKLAQQGLDMGFGTPDCLESYVRPGRSRRRCPGYGRGHAPEHGMVRRAPGPRTVGG